MRTATAAASASWRASPARGPASTSRNSAGTGSWSWNRAIEVIGSWSTPARRSRNRDANSAPWNATIVFVLRNDSRELRAPGLSGGVPGSLEHADVGPTEPVDRLLRVADRERVAEPAGRPARTRCANSRACTGLTSWYSSTSSACGRPLEPATARLEAFEQAQAPQLQVAEVEHAPRRASGLLVRPVERLEQRAHGARDLAGPVLLRAARRPPARRRRTPRRRASVATPLGRGRHAPMLFA